MAEKTRTEIYNSDELDATADSIIDMFNMFLVAGGQTPIPPRNEN